MRRNGAGRKSFLLAALLLAASAGVSVTAVHAQQRAAQRQFDFNIPAKPVTQAVNDIGRVAGLSVVFRENRPIAAMGRAVRGSLTADQALAMLLAGTGLTYRFSNAGTVQIFDPSASSENGAALADDGSTVLDTIEVAGVRGDGTRGYVATRSSAGTKTDTPLIETPRSISVVTRQELDNRGVQSVPEAVRYTSGVTTGAFGYDPRFDQIYIRGFATTTLGDYRDGLRQISGGYATFRTEPYSLDRIDIVKGPVSVLYGQGTPGGLIDRQSKLPTEEAHHEIEAQAGSYGRLQGAFDIGGPVDPDRKFLYRIVALGRAGETNYDIEDRRLLLAPSFTWRPTDGSSLTVYSLAQQDETDSNVAMINRNSRTSSLRASDPNYDYQKQKQFQIGYNLSHRINDVWTLRQNLRFGVVDLDSRYLTGGVTGGGFANASSSVYRRGTAAVVERLRTFQVDNQAQADFATGSLQHTLLLGLDYAHMNSRFDTGTSAANPAFALDVLNPYYGLSGATPAITSRTNTDFDQVGLYAQDQIRLGNWRLSLGGRQDWTDRTQTNLLTGGVNSKRNDDAFSYNAGLLYLFDNGIAPYVSYSTSFQPTSSLDRDGRVLEPSEGEQLEAGVKYQPADGRLSLTLSAYQLIEKNAAKYAGFNGATGQYYYESIGRIRTQGIEVEGRGKITDSLEAIASYTFVDAEITRSNTAAEIGKVPAVTPRHAASLWLSYTVQSGALAGLGGGIGVRYIGETWGNNTNTMRNDAYTLLDASLRYDLGGLDDRLTGFSVAVNATNLTDKRAEICNAGTCYLGQGRTVLGTLKYKW